MGNGQTNGEIAEELDIRECTVKGHVQEIFNKLGVETRTQAAVVGLRSRR